MSTKRDIDDGMYAQDVAVKFDFTVKWLSRDERDGARWTSALENVAEKSRARKISSYRMYELAEF